MVHVTLEKLYKDLQFSKENTLEELLKFYNDSWKNEWDNDIVINHQYEEQNYQKMGEKYITDYYKRFHPFNQSKTIGLEQRVIVKLNNEKLKMQGYIDRLTSSKDGKYEIHDYKTSGRLPTNDDMKKDRQLALYSIAIRDDYQDVKEIKLIWHFLKFDKDIVVQKTQEELEELKKNTSTLIKKVGLAKEYKAKISALCNWCEFKGICPEWSHVLKTEKMEPNEYLKDPGVKLVNRYAQLTEEKKEAVKKLDEEIEKVKEAIIEFSKKNNSDTISGSEYLARIRTYPKVTVPAKGEEKRELLEKLIKGYGKWDDVADMSAFNLSRIIADNAWPPELIEQIKNFIEEGKRTQIYLNKNKN